jgi:hypothetical protein
MGAGHVNGRWVNVAMVLVVAVTILLGVTGMVKAIAGATGLALPGGQWLLASSAVVTLLICLPVTRRMRANRRLALPNRRI